MKSEYKERCGLCLESKNNPTFARIYYKQINEEFIYLCEKCWNIAESKNLYAFIFSNSRTELYWSGNEQGVKIMQRYKRENEILEVRNFLNKAVLGWLHVTKYGAIFCIQSASVDIKKESGDVLKTSHR